MSTSRDKQTKGPACYENWLKALQGKPLQWTVEFPLYSDVERIVGELTSGCGPYQLLNTAAFPFPKEPPLRPVVVLRVDDHEEFEVGDMDRTDTQNYHGGNLCDEIAALISLCLGIRLKAGEISRRFDPNRDPKGRPQFIGFQETPSLSKNRRGRMLPGAIGARSIQEIPLLCQVPKLSPAGAANLVRSARLYQQAIWLAEAAPETSWLLLVSSIEVAATHHVVEKAPIETIVEIMQTSEPKLVDVLKCWGGQELVTKIAQLRKKQFAATRKFREFVFGFCPPPPEHRPPDALRTVWKDNADSFNESLTTIYGHRSDALHDGIPFPLPMCEPPIPIDDCFSEIPAGVATQGKGGTWRHEDTPMLLHVFEYIVRNALLKWWEAMLTENLRQEARI